MFGFVISGELYGDLRFVSLIFVWYYFLYDDWSMYVVYDFLDLVLVKRISVW